MAGAGIFRWVLGKAFRLPPRQSGQVRVERDLRVPMRDGVTLLADRHYVPGAGNAPVVLMRSPYGRGAIFGMMASLMAERGLQVVVQSVRGTCGSGGTFDPMRQEAADGADTLAWLQTEPWFAGRLYGFGTSYLGNAQWALAQAAPEGIHGLALSMTLSNFRDELRGFGGFTQAGMLGWTDLMRDMIGWAPGEHRPMKRPQPGKLDHVQAHLPLGTMDEAAFGERVSWWRDWTAHDPDDPWWDAIDHKQAPVELAAPVAMLAGWQDVFLPFQLDDFARRQAAGKPAWLIVGPWSHSSPAGMIAWLRESIRFFTALAENKVPFADRLPVRLYVQGARKWRDYASWPPPQSRPLRLHLAPDRKLAFDPIQQGDGAVGYSYDPVDPTPSVHGPMVMGASKLRDMSALEDRADTVSFTSEPLESDVEAIGPVRLELAIRSDRENTDFYACLCEVDRKGRPIHVTDGYVRLVPGKPQADAQGVRRIVIECWPTAWRFAKGRRLRLIVASGAHPRYARNPGTGEPLAIATELVPARQEILCGPGYGSALVLTV